MAHITEELDRRQTEKNSVVKNNSAKGSSATNNLIAVKTT